MATLTETAYLSRKIIKWSVAGLIGLTILRISFGMFVNFLKETFPEKPLKPNYAFGKLPAIQFPQQATPAAEISYSVQTIEGVIPEASEAARVYFMPKNRANLLSLSRAQSLVGQFGFTASPQHQQNNMYKWTNQNNPLRTITVDIVNSHFTIKYDYLNDLALFNENQLPNSQQAVLEANAFINISNYEMSDLNLSSPKIQYLKLVGDQLTPTASQREANAVKLDFFRKTYDGMNVLNDTTNEGVISFILGPSRKIEKRFLFISFNYWPIDNSASAIYKLKTSSAAYEELKAGRAYFAFTPTSINKITITKVYLAYYDSIAPQLYLQPVFVFEGENNFLAYVGAIVPPWTE